MSPHRARASAQWLLVLLILVYAFLAGGYFVLRYAGRWSDSDTANLTLATAAVVDEGTLVPTQRAYRLGFAYQALSTFALSATGLSVLQLQFLVYPLVIAGLASVAFVLYRALTGDAIMGAMATCLLLMQPDFLFVVLRSSHEKVTWLAAMLALLLLSKSFTAQRLSRLAACVLLFYLVISALVASNSFFGSSFIVAIVVGLAAGFVVLRPSIRLQAEPRLRRAVLRLGYVCAAVLVVWFLVTFYFYPPAATALADLQRTVDRAAAVALGQEAQYDPYATVRSGWVSQTAYLGLTLPTWITAFLSFVAWARIGFQVLRGHNPLKGREQLLMWLLYTGFGLQLALSLVLSYAGGVSGNLQVRLFPAVMLIALPLLAWSYAHPWALGAEGHKGSVWRIVLGLAIVWAAGASLLKTTNDPWLSNYANFWTGNEEQAVRWVENHIQYRSVWLGLSGIRTASRAVAGGFGDETQNQVDTWVVDAGTRDLLLSGADAILSLKTAMPLPDVSAEQRVYDNGDAWMYHKRPWTPYQQ